MTHPSRTTTRAQHLQASSATGSRCLAVGINRGYGALVQGDYGRCTKTCWTTHSQIAIRLGDVHGRAMVLGNLGFALCELAEPSACRTAVLRGARAVAAASRGRGPTRTSWTGWPPSQSAERDADVGRRACSALCRCAWTRSRAGAGPNRSRDRVVDRARARRATLRSTTSAGRSQTCTRGAVMSLDEAVAYSREDADV